MTRLKRSLPVLLGAGLLLSGLAGCVTRTHVVARPTLATNVKVSSLPALVDKINRDAATVQSLRATVEIGTSVGGQKKGKVTEYQEVPGFLLVKKPGDLRMIGLVPVVRTRLFDMASDGNQFKLSIPPKNKFIIGSNEVTVPSQNEMENIRPQAILDALLLRPIDPKEEIAVIRQGSDVPLDVHQKTKSNKQVVAPTYVVLVIHRAPPRGAVDWYLSRRIVFDRTDLKPHLQEFFDVDGNLVTQATYEAFTEQKGISFPSMIRIVRPREEYEITIAITKLELNVDLAADQFELKQPEGAQLQVLK